MSTAETARAVQADRLGAFIAALFMAAGVSRQAAETVARETPLWHAWIHERFPMPSETSQRE